MRSASERRKPGRNQKDRKSSRFNASYKKKRTLANEQRLRRLNGKKRSVGKMRSLQ